MIRQLAAFLPQYPLLGRVKVRCACHSAGVEFLAPGREE